MPVKYTGKSYAAILQDLKKFKLQFATIVGTEAVNFFKSSFDRQGFVEDRKIAKWKPRLPGFKARTGGATLVKTGRLKRSIRITYKSPGLVKVGTDVVYARIHNEGGVISQTLSAKQVKYFWYLFKSTGNETYKAIALAKRVTIHIPKRQFIGRSKFLDDRIGMILQRELLKVFN